MKSNSTHLPSLFKGFFTKQSVVAEWSTVYDYLTCGELQELTEQYRTTHEWRYKSALLSITPACSLNGTGKEASDILGLTGIGMADFDHLLPERIEGARKAVNADPHTFLSYSTASSEGLRVLFRYRDGIPYDEAFLIGNCYYADLIGHEFDEKCVNVNRLSALCHDPLAFFNEEAVPFSAPGEYAESEFCTSPSQGIADRVPGNALDSATPQTNNMPRSSNSKHSSQRNAGGLPSDIPSRNEPFSLTDYAAKVVEKHGDYYTPGNRNQYLMKCLMMMNKLGVSQYEAEQWALSHDLGETETRRIVRSCYHHAAEHGIYEPPRIAFPTPFTAKSCKVAQVADGLGSTHTCVREDEEKITLPNPPLLPRYQWPRFLQQIVDCGETNAQRDALLLGALTVLGASLNRLVRSLYGRKYIYPCLQTFVVAPPASGKGALTWVRKLVEPIHGRMMDEYHRAMELYKQEKLAFEQAGRNKTEINMPELPPMKMFLIAGNNSATGMLENLMDAGGVGLMCESEADTVSTAIGTDYGHWSDTLRKAFDHDRLSFNRRTNHEYREISQTYLSVLLSGTPAQVKPLIPSAENGLFSRQIFYSMPATSGWVNQFGSREEYDNLDHCFETWGKEWEQRLKELAPCVSVLHFELSDTQQLRFNNTFAHLFDTACLTMNGTMKSSVARLAVNILRLMSIVAFLRAVEEKQEFLPSEDIPAENIADKTASRFISRITEEDFDAVLSLAQPLYLHAAYVLALLPEVEVAPQKVKITDALLAQLGQEFTTEQARDAAGTMGICAGTLKSHLHRLVKEGVLQRMGRGCYRISQTSVSTEKEPCKDA